MNFGHDLSFGGSGRQAAAGGGGAPEPAGPKIYELTGTARTNTNNAVWTTAFSIPIAAGKEYEIEVLAKALQSSTSDGIKWRVSGIPTGATVGMWTDLQDTASSAINHERLFVTGENAASTSNFAASATRYAHRLVIAVSKTDAGTPISAGTLLIQFARTQAAGTATVDVGTKCVVHEVTIVRLAATVDTTSNTVFEDILSATLAANTNYLARWLIGATAAASSTGYRFQGANLPVGATSNRACAYLQAGASPQGLVSKNGTAMTGGGSGPGAGAVDALIMSELIQTGANAGTYTLQGCSEINTSQVDFLAGSVLILREIGTPVVQVGDNAMADGDANYETLVSFVLAASTHYHALWAFGLTFGSSGERIQTRMTNLPTNGVSWFDNYQCNGLSSGLMRHNRVDDTEMGEGGATATVEVVGPGNGFFYGGDGGTMTYQGAGNGGGSTPNFKAGSWLILEACDYEAVPA